MLSRLNVQEPLWTPTATGGIARTAQSWESCCCPLTSASTPLLPWDVREEEHFPSTRGTASPRGTTLRTSRLRRREEVGDTAPGCRDPARSHLLLPALPHRRRSCPTPGCRASSAGHRPCGGRARLQHGVAVLAVMVQLHPSARQPRGNVKPSPGSERDKGDGSAGHSPQPDRTWLRVGSGNQREPHGAAPISKEAAQEPAPANWNRGGFS